MNETQVNALLAALTNQRNAALNDAAQQAATVVVQAAQIADLTKQLEAATTLIGEHAEVVEEPAKSSATVAPA